MPENCGSRFRYHWRNADGSTATILAKMEYLNPGGSVKECIASGAWIQRLILRNLAATGQICIRIGIGLFIIPPIRPSTDHGTRNSKSNRGKDNGFCVGSRDRRDNYGCR